MNALAARKDDHSTQRKHDPSSQCARILRVLKKHRRITNVQMIKMNILRGSERIRELKSERFKPSPDFEDIPRRSPVIEVPLRDRTEKLTWYNTCIVFYTQDEYLDMTHVAITDQEQGSRGLVFNSRPLVQVLMSHKFPMRSSPEPSRGELEAYYRYQADEIESELPRFMDEE